MLTFTQLREQYKTFFFHRFDIFEDDHAINITFHFEIEGLASFAPSWTFKKNGRERCKVSHPLFRRLAFCLGLVELISYWKTACPKKVVVCCGALSDEEILWWKKQYFEGLGEFFYKNKISTDFAGFMELTAVGEELPLCYPGYPLAGALIPVGGGKDSLVTLKLLAPKKEQTLCYLLNPRASMKNGVLAAGYSENSIISPRRTLDKNMLDLNAKGFLNGHTPFSALIAFSAMLTALLYGKKDVVLSNEQSANESTVAGLSVNHQYSKSFQFEKDFDDYEKKFLHTGIRYFSLLRPWSEIQIAACFSSFPELFPIFRSCNAGSKKDAWCKNCPKCLFIYLILAPFLSLSEITAIFGEDLSEKETLLPVLEQLIGITEEKPFECVGSREEINFALCMTIKQREKANEPLSVLYKYYKTTELYRQYSKRQVPYGGFYEQENLLPPEYAEILRSATKKEEERWLQM